MKTHTDLLSADSAINTAVSRTVYLLNVLTFHAHSLFPYFCSEMHWSMFCSHSDKYIDLTQVFIRFPHSLFSMAGKTYLSKTLVDVLCARNTLGAIYATVRQWRDSEQELKHCLKNQIKLFISLYSQILKEWLILWFIFIYLALRVFHRRIK